MFTTKWKRIGVGTLLAGTIATGGTFAADRAIDPYTDKGTHFELPLVSDIPQGERVEIAKDRAAMTLKFWNDEGSITIEPQIPTAQLGAAERPFQKPAERPLLSKQMQFREGDVTAFIEPKAGTENEFDIDFTLHAKPDTNVFTYKIKGAEEFDFFYQPELTQEEIDEGASRPENVVGSYAVYHKEKANNEIGKTNYATGKIMHIYRPKAIDADGNEVWAELSYDNGVLSVEVPQKFLDSAVYPVVVDPTFGYTTIGITNQSICQTFNSQSLRRGNGVTLSENGTLDSISANVFSNGADQTDPVNLAFAINTENTGTDSHAEVVMLIGDGGTTITTSDTWITLNGSDEVLTAGAVILNAFCDGADSNNQIDINFDDTGSRTNYTETFTGAGAGNFTNAQEDPWTETDATADNLYSLYATYTASGGAAPADDTYFELLDD